MDYLKNSLNNKYIIKRIQTQNSIYKNKLIILILILIFVLLLFITKSQYSLKEIIKYSTKSIFYSNDIYNRIQLLKILTNNNILLYKGAEKCLLKNPDRQLCFYHLICPRKVVGKKRILLGPKLDGSYVLLNDFKNIKIAYSFGISNVIQFDKELAKRDIDIYMYDHTINSLPYSDPKFHWKKIGICGKNEKKENLKTLEELLFENGHFSERNMILKLDVESWEWKALNDLKNEILYQFKYIIIEFHFSNIKKEEKLYYKVLKKINKSHQVFYFRCNSRNTIINYRNNRICKYIELSYIIKEGNFFEKDDSIYPIYDFDFEGPKDNGITEINLNILKLFDFNV